MSNVIGTPCPAQCGELVSPLGSRVREGGQDWHVHCYLKPKLEAAKEEHVKNLTAEFAGTKATLVSELNRLQEEVRVLRARPELKGKEVPVIVADKASAVVLGKLGLPGLQELLDSSVERARDPVLYDVVALGDSHPVKLGKEPRGHSAPRLVTFRNGVWTESDHGEVLTCSCGSPQCRLIDKLGLPRMVWSRRVQKIEDQDQRDELVRRLRK